MCIIKTFRRLAAIFLPVIIILSLNSHTFASAFDNLSADQIKEMNKVMFSQSVKNMRPELFSKLSQIQQETIRERAKMQGLNLPQFMLPLSQPTLNKNPVKNPLPSRPILNNTAPKLNIPQKPFSDYFNYSPYEKILDALAKNPEYKIFERDIPLSSEYEKVEKNKESDPFYQEIQNFDFKKDYMVIYNNDVYWKELNKQRAPSDLEEGENSFHGKPITSQLKNQIHSDLIGYHLYLPKDPGKVQAIVICVYGGSQKSEQKVKDFMSFRLHDSVTNYLLSRNIGILILDTIDQLENSHPQLKMTKEMYTKVLGNIKKMGEILSNPEIAKQVHEKLGYLPQNIPLYVYGASFGGGVALRALEEFPKLFKGAISFEGVLMAHWDNINNDYKTEDYVVPGRNLDKLNKNALLIQNYNDNNVKLPEVLQFYEKAREMKKSDLLKLFFLAEGELKTEEDGNIGHDFSSKFLYTKRIALEINDFIEKTKNGVIDFGSQFNELRYFYHKTAYNQQLTNNSFKEKFLSIAFKIYQNARLEQDTTFMKDWFGIVGSLISFKDNQEFRQIASHISEDAWNRLYFPIVVKLLVNEIIEERYDGSKMDMSLLSKATFETQFVSEVFNKTVQSLVKETQVKGGEEYKKTLLEGLFSSDKDKFILKTKITPFKDKKFASLFLYNFFCAQKDTSPFFQNLKSQFGFLIKARKRQLLSAGLVQIKEASKVLRGNEQLKLEYDNVPGSQLLQQETEALKSQNPTKIKEIADKYYSLKDYRKAIKLYEKAVELGDTDAMMALGNMYYLEEGVTHDSKKMIELYEKAANLNNPSAVEFLGNVYYHGDVYDIKQDYQKAIEWYQKAVDLGNTMAMNSLGNMYRDGYGVAQDYKQAFDWYEKAAKLKNTTAMINLGNLYVNGQGIKKDFKQAFEWYQKAAQLGNREGMSNLGYMYREGYGVVQDYKQAFEWYEKAAKLDDGVAMSNLGNMYRDGYGVAQDYKKAVDFYEKAAELKSAVAMINLGNLYVNGQGIKKDFKQAFEWYQKAAELGNRGGMRNLGYMYREGYWVVQDYKQAFEWYEKAAKLDDGVAMSNLGYMYQYGKGVAQDYQKAIEWYQEGAKLGDRNAMNKLGDMYRDGEGIEKHPEKSNYWYQKAKELEKK